jgi:hypothetical protein
MAHHHMKQLQGLQLGMCCMGLVLVLVLVLLSRAVCLYCEQHRTPRAACLQPGRQTGLQQPHLHAWITSATGIRGRHLMAKQVLHGLLVMAHPATYHGGRAIEERLGQAVRQRGHHTSIDCQARDTA